jgi:hypothetical protein
MAAATVIVWDGSGRLTADARTLLEAPFARIVEANDEDDFRDALHGAPNPVVLLDRRTVGDALGTAIVRAAAVDALVVVVGPATADECCRDRDLGALLLFAEPPMRIVWRGTLRRLVGVSRRRTADSTSTPTA